MVVIVFISFSLYLNSCLCPWKKIIDNNFWCIFPLY